MMDGFVSSWEHHEPSACIAGLPADEPSLFISLASLSGQQRRWPTAEASVECLISAATWAVIAPSQLAALSWKI